MALNNMPCKDGRNEESTLAMESSEIDPMTFFNSIQTVSNNHVDQTVTLNGEDGSTFQTLSVPLSFQNITQSLKYFVIVGHDTQNVVNNQFYSFVPPEDNSLYSKEGISSISGLPTLPTSVQKDDFNSDILSKTATCSSVQVADIGSVLLSKTDTNNAILSKTDASKENLSFEDRIAKRNSLLPKKLSRKRLKVITCDKCKAVFKRPLQYYAHRNIHMQKGENTVFICAQCGKDFKDSCLLKAHELKEHGEVRLYPCPHCNHSFKTNFLLDSHTRSIHKGEKKYKCKFCNYKCFRVNDLKRHLDIHFGIKSHVCYICGHQFSHPSNLMRHLRIHVNVKRHVCRICKRSFSQLSSLYAHEFSHSGGVCSECDAKFKTIRSLRNHLKRNHNKDIHTKDLKYMINNNKVLPNVVQDSIRLRYFSCQVCLQRFRFKKALKTHEKVAHSNKLLSCESCFKVFETIEEMKLHSCTVKESNVCSKSIENSKFTLDKKFYECVKCTTWFESFKESETHICRKALQNRNCSDSVSNKPEVSVSTSKCELQNGEVIVYIISNGKENSESEEIISFINPVTDNNTIKVKRVKQIKSKLSSKNKSTETSQDGSIDKTSPPLKCETCSKTFTKKWNWSQHVATHDSTLRSYKCDVCSASFSYRSTYTNHIRRAHSEQGAREMFNCKHCSKTYKFKSSLNQHIRRIHLAERNYQCNLCSKKFFTKTEFNYHMTIHREELPFTCVFCGKGFRHLSNLKRHERTHSGERPHKCPHCPKAYIQSVTLRIHLRKHENVINVQKLDNIEENSFCASTDEPFTTDEGVP